MRSSTWAVKPKASPLAIEKESGTVMMVRNAGIASTGSSQWISRAWDAISDPTLVPLSDMYVTKARDGAALFPNKPYNAFCNEP